MKFNNIINIFRRKKERKYIENFGEAFLRLAHILSDEESTGFAYAIALNVTSDYDNWTESKKIDFSNEIRKDEKLRNPKI